MTITDLLTQDHREAEMLMSQLDGKGDQETFGRLKNALTMHTQIEEEIFYPAMEDFEESEELIEIAYQEHNDVDQILEEMSATEAASEDFQELLRQLKESVDHHVQEEENQLFPLAETLLGIEMLEEMADSALKLKNDVSVMEYSTV